MSVNVQAGFCEVWPFFFFSGDVEEANLSRANCLCLKFRGVVLILVAIHDFVFVAPLSDNRQGEKTAQNSSKPRELMIDVWTAVNHRSATRKSRYKGGAGRATFDALVALC